MQHLLTSFMGKAPREFFSVRLRHSQFNDVKKQPELFHKTSTLQRNKFWPSKYCAKKLALIIVLQSQEEIQKTKKTEKQIIKRKDVPKKTILC